MPNFFFIRKKKEKKNQLISLLKLAPDVFCHLIFLQISDMDVNLEAWQIQSVLCSFKNQDII